MTTYHWLSLVACASQLALAVLLLGRSARDRMATVLGLLALDLFAWNAADVAADFADASLWNALDHAASALTTPLAFHFLLLFVGRARRHRWLIRGCYTYFASVALISFLLDLGGTLPWAALLVAGLIPAIGLAIALLLRHLVQLQSPEERARTHLVLLAIMIGTIFGTSDLVRILQVPVPRLSNSGTMMSVLLLAIAALRFRLFERNLSRLNAVVALAAGAVAVGAYLISFARFGTNWAGLVLATGAVTVALVLGLRRLLVGLGEERARTTNHAILGRFAQQMAHDLRNPLAAAKGAAQFLLQERREGRSIDEQLAFLELVEEQVERVSRAITEYQRLGRVEPCPELLDLNQVVHQAVVAMRQARSGSEVEAVLARPLPACLADPGLLLHAVENLIRNAYDASEPSGRVVIRTSAAHHGSRLGLMISIEDDGCGMSPRVRERALEEFFTTKAQGSGIGLAFVQRVAEAHQGELSILSEEGRGTIVKLWDAGRGGERMSSAGSVLFVDDDPAVGVVLAAQLRQAGFTAQHVESAEAGLERLAREDLDVVITDERMPGMRGLEFLALLRSRWPQTPVIVLTSHGTIELAVQAMKAGAYDFMLKPFDREEVIFTVTKAVATARHRAEQPPSAGSGRIHHTRAMVEVHQLIARAALSRATVLIRGESGTGKGVAARSIHQQSPRREGPFVAIHCGALPDALLESELFGYEKGAFTGAASAKPGRVELSEGGTLFLDEIGDVTPAFQVKILRLLQERTYERLGSLDTRTADVRFIAATHRDLEQMVREGTFREDLFYRLNVVPLVMPPLRERRSEIAELARRFCSDLAAANARSALSVDAAALELLEQQPWPGNVRQLENFIERLVVLSDGPILGVDQVARELRRQGELITKERFSLDDHRRNAEREALHDALSRAGGNRSAAARILNISRRTLYNKLHEHGLI